MIEHHNSIKNEYLIPNIVLKADVVINMPKPKTHKRAGVTIALKNMIGITGRKDWLPHHSQGSVEEKGDEYFKKSKIKHSIVILQEKIEEIGAKKKYLSKYTLKSIQLCLKVIYKIYVKDSTNDGSWHGNNTIWRTILDLNRIIQYADKNGVVHNKPQRKLFVVADMIISGEKEGPLIPSPKSIGIIGVGANFTTFDMFCTTLMGFDIKKINTLKNAVLNEKHSLISNHKECTIKSNNDFWNNKKLVEIDKNTTLKFIPPSG